MRLHVLGLSHTKVSRSYSACSFTGKVRLLCYMLTRQGYHTTLYAPEGSEAECTELVPVLDDATFQQVHGGRDWRTEGFRLGRDNPAYAAFRDNAIREIAARAQPGDYCLCPFGMDHAPIAEAVQALVPGVLVVESGIGYVDTFAKFRVFESAIWWHVALGREGAYTTPSFWDTVIPNAYSVEAYPYKEQKQGYHLFIGRPNWDKGLSIARDVCAELGVPLYTAGQGSPDYWQGTHYLGVLEAEERNHWMVGASAVWCPSLYAEPWCNAALEAQACGTPVLTTPFGAFAENMLHGITGYRCATYGEFLWAARHVDQLDPRACREWVVRNFSTEVIGARYSAYFERLAQHPDAGGDGWYARDLGPTQEAVLSTPYPTYPQCVTATPEASATARA